MKQDISFADWEAKRMEDPEFRAAAERLEPGHQVARLRISRGLTQAQLAERVQTTQSAIARLESGRKDPSLSYLRKVLGALGYGFVLHAEPLDSQQRQKA
jgi:transcriptional regulator with XRE-family HTH domain